MRTAPWAVVPVKRLDRAKSRLAPVLGPADRIRLARAMCLDVLGTLAAEPRLGGILVVSSDPEVAAMADSLGAGVCEDGPVEGTDAAIRTGLSALDRRTADPCLVVPADIPFLTAEELTRMIDGLGSAPIVICPALGDGGTNLMALAQTSLIPTAFGCDSFARHLAAARARDLTCRIERLAGAGRDIDRPQDLAQAAPLHRRLGSGGRTIACLHDIGAMPDADRNILEGVAP